jgi:hypothetical protein
MSTENQIPSNVHFGDRYLRNRPFLVINTAAKAKRLVQTHVKGWGDSETNWDMTEKADVVDRVSDKMLREATFVIDILNNKLVKNRHSGQAEDDTILQHFINKYGNQITQGLQAWGSQNSPVPSVSVVGDIEDIVKDDE